MVTRTDNSCGWGMYLQVLCSSNATSTNATSPNITVQTEAILSTIDLRNSTFSVHARTWKMIEFSS